MVNNTNINSKKSNNIFYYIAWSVSTLSSCTGIVMLVVAPYIECLAPVVGFATPPVFVVLATILAISVLAILYKAFSKSNTISQEAEPVEKAEEVIEECDNAEQPIVAPSAPTHELVTAAGSVSGAEQPIVAPSALVNETAAGSGSGAEQPEQKKGWLASLSSAWGCAKSCGTYLKELVCGSVCTRIEHIKANPKTTIACMTAVGAIGTVAVVGLPATVAGMSAGVGTVFNMATTSAAVKATTNYFNWS